MRPNCVVCLISAALGAVLMQLAQSFLPDSTNMVVAQGPIPYAIPQPSAAPPTTSPTTSPPAVSPLHGGSVTALPVAQTPHFEPELYTPEERVNIAVYEATNRSVVNIATEIRGQRFMMFDLPSDKGAGSGAVLDTTGHILTNYHVIEGARAIQVTLYDGNTYEARLVGHDASTDIAVIKIDAPAETLFPSRMGDSTRLKVGQRVFAIGNPFGLERTLTTGIISSLNRTLPARNNRRIRSIIQIDAAINPGNSGGPLIDSQARLIGMNTAIASSTGQSAGVGFAIPASVINRVVPQLIARGRVVRPESGISRVLETDEGLVVATLIPGGPAEVAGLQGFKVTRQKKRQGPFVYEHETIDRSAADLIVGVDNEKIVNADDFLSAVESKQPGQDISVEVIRNKQRIRIPVRLTQSDP